QLPAMRTPSLISLFVLAIAAMPSGKAEENRLSEAERTAGWELLFDGNTMKGWRGYRDAPIAGWEVIDGTLHAIAKIRGVELVTVKTFSDFELVWEWKLPHAGNNGLKYFVTEARPSAPGHEYQLLDDENHPDGKIGPHRQTGAFYDVLPPAADKPSKPIGEWNLSKIVVRGNHVEHWLNGKQVLAYELGSPEVKAGLAKSKFTRQAGFGEKITGHLMLTYHSDDCWYRNIKIREFK
ncbi:MAG: family 16 glycoside hydrolase, partial [Opitutaceae bacterium]